MTAARRHQAAVPVARAVGVLALVAATAAAAQSSPSTPSAWPTKGWPAATPQSVGLNASVLCSIDAEIAAGRYGYVDRMPRAPIVARLVGAITGR